MEGLELDDLKDLFQPKPCRDSMKNHNDIGALPCDPATIKSGLQIAFNPLDSPVND